MPNMEFYIWNWPAPNLEYGQLIIKIYTKYNNISKEPWRHKIFYMYMKTIFICKAWVMDSIVWLVLVFSWRRVSHVEKGAAELVSPPCSN